MSWCEMFEESSIIVLVIVWLWMHSYCTHLSRFGTALWFNGKWTCISIVLVFYSTDPSFTTLITFAHWWLRLSHNDLTHHQQQFEMCIFLKDGSMFIIPTAFQVTADYRHLMYLLHPGTVVGILVLFYPLALVFVIFFTFISV